MYQFIDNNLESICVITMMVCIILAFLLTIACRDMLKKSNYIQYLVNDNYDYSVANYNLKEQLQYLEAYVYDNMPPMEVKEGNGYSYIKPTEVLKLEKVTLN